MRVDSASSQYESQASPPALSLEQAGDALHYRAALLGKEYPVSLEWLNRWERVRKEYASLLTPRPIRVIEQVYSLSSAGLRAAYDRYKAEQYAQNVAKAQEGVPIP